MATARTMNSVPRGRLLFVAVLCLSLLLQHSQAHNATSIRGISMSHEEAEKIAREALGQLLSSFFTSDEESGHENTEGERMLQDNSVPCNSVIGTLTTNDLKAMVVTLMEDKTPLPPFAITALDIVVLGQLQHDIQLWKVCGRCSDFVDNNLYPKDVGCREDGYGYNAMHSGLLVAPYDARNGRLIRDTLPVNILPASESVIPSQSTLPLAAHSPLVGCLISSVTRTYTLLPDYIGRGESSDYYRSFLVKQTIIDSVIPLIWQSERIVAADSDCSAALAEAYSLVGYSQGGYSVVAISDALARMGKTIISVYGGGAPYRLSSSTLTFFVETIREGVKPIAFFITLLAAAFSSTDSNVANFDAGQDFLEGHVRDDLVAEAQNAGEDRTPIYSYIPPHAPLSIYNQDLISMLQAARLRGEEDPCVTSVNNKTDLICKALQDQDLIQELESANYPVFLCHSTDDDSIPMENLPDISKNPDYLSLKTSKGTHWEAATPCFLDAIFAALNPLNLKWYPVEERTKSGGCGGEDEDCSFIDKLFGHCSTGVVSRLIHNP